MQPKNGDDFGASIVNLIPDLRSYGRYLSHDQDMTKDLVQETLLKAWTNQRQFTAGSNMKAWLFTILRNNFYEIKRKEKKILQAANDMDDCSFAPPRQEHQVILREAEAAINALPTNHQEVLSLVSGMGMSYEEAAHICICPIGTIKSRLSRARSEILKRIGG